MTTKATQSLRAKLEQKKGQRDYLIRLIADTRGKIEDKEKDLDNHEKAREVIREVSLKTQKQLEYNISEITSTALSAVLDDPYELDVEFVQRRNKTECDLFFVRGGNKIDPTDGGGGAVDIASFALRVASWSIQNPRTRPVLILDEPFKHLKGEEANRKMLAMVREITEKLGLQVIMISDERVSREATIEATDRLFEARMKNGRTKMVKIK